MFLSGGAANAAPIASLGGVKSSGVATLATLFDDVTSAESTAGDVEYRCVYIKNAHATLTLNNAVKWITANTPNTSTVIEIGVGSSAINGLEQTVANENSGPAGVTFLPAATKVAGVALGNIPPGGTRAVWFRRTVSAGAPAIAADTYATYVEGDTL